MVIPSDDSRLLCSLDEVRKYLDGTHGSLYTSRDEIEGVVGKILRKIDITKEDVSVTDEEVEDLLKEIRFEKRLRELGQDLITLNLPNAVIRRSSVVGHADAYRPRDLVKLEWIFSFLVDHVVEAYNRSVSENNIKNVTDIGNSAGVIIPAKYRGRKALLLENDDRLAILVAYGHNKIYV